MKVLSRQRTWTLTVAVVLTATIAFAQQKPFEPEVGQAGKDVVWVPSPEEMVQKMMEMARGHAAGFRRRSRLGRRPQRHRRGQARRAGAGRRVQPRHGGALEAAGQPKPACRTKRSSFRATCSRPSSPRPRCWRCSCCPATCCSCESKFADLRPGTRIVSNTFSIQDWTPDKTETLERLHAAGAPRCSTSCRPRWRARGGCRRASWR